MTDKLRYSLVWKECGADSVLASRFFVPGFNGFLPFFIWAEDVETLEKGEKVELHEQQLLKGILYGLYEMDHDSKPWHDKKSRRTYLHLLDVLKNGFGFENPEMMILSVAADVREQHGSEPSHRMLISGTKLIPDSSKIKSDLICDLWEIIAAEKRNDGLSEEQEEMLDQILGLIDEIIMQELHPSPREIICFLGLTALILFERNEKIDNYLEKFIYPNVNNPVLKNKIKFMLENPDQVSIEPLEDMLQ